MPDSQFIENDFLNQIAEIISENISNERFGVSELAREVGMSRSNLLRKVKSLTKLSVSQYISQLRLKHAMEMLKQNSYTVSEVSYKVGFNSTSYFIKCFREYYGYPPGEVGNREITKKTEVKTRKKPNIIVLVSSLFIVVLMAVLFVLKPFSTKIIELEKSIVVLPFINDSNDSTNVYIINGLMESILTNLQKIEDLKVISRTSAEKYRNHSKTITEIAKELNVSYFVEGSGQKIGDQIMLNIQLIEAQTDKHLWAQQYKREAKDIFNLQQEIAKNIADKIEVIITPEEKEQINKIPTEDLVAYDYFLKGLDLMHKGNYESLEEGITWFQKAINRDNKFARAHAGLAISYFFLDAMFAEKKYSEMINNYADKALLLDSKLPQSLIAKALYFINNGENVLALPYLEKALEYNPNSALVINILSDFYVRYIPNTEKYLEYALKGIRLDIAANDSVTASFIYLHISNAFIQSGFVNEAEKYINKSLEYDPNNLYSEYVKAFILYAKNPDLSQIRERLIATLNKDTSRLDVLQEVGKICYFMRDYDNAYKYYKRFVDTKEEQNLDIYRVENSKIGAVYKKAGQLQKAENLLADFKEYAENEKSIYKPLNLAMSFSHSGDTINALKQLEFFSKETNYHYWILLFFEIDPLMDNVRDLPEFKKILAEIESKFWENHERIKATLQKKKLL